MGIPAQPEGDQLCFHCGSYIESLKAWVNQITGESYIAKVGSKGLLELNDFARDFAEVCLR